MSEQTLKFELEREGFPIEIGSSKFFFGTSVEDLTRFFTLLDDVEKEAAKLADQIDAKKITDEVTAENVDEIMKLQRGIAKIQYDAALGEGAFEKIYEEFPYIDVLLEKYDEIDFHIAERVEKETTLRADKFNKKKAEMMKKKAIKKRKRKSK